MMLFIQKIHAFHKASLITIGSRRFLSRKSMISLQKVGPESTASYVYDMHEFRFTDSFDNITIKREGLCVLCNI